MVRLVAATTSACLGQNGRSVDNDRCLRVASTGYGHWGMLGLLSMFRLARTEFDRTGKDMKLWNVNNEVQSFFRSRDLFVSLDGVPR